MSTPSILSLEKFTSYATAWANFIVGAGANDVRQLFQGPEAGQAQLYVSFDLTSTILPLLSTVGMAMVRTRFVLLPTHADADKQQPSFGIVVYAADAQGGRISAYYLGTSRYMDYSNQAKSCESMRPAKPVASPDPTETEMPIVLDGDPTGNGMVPFNLAKTWVCNWCWAVQDGSLDPAIFATSYGPLQGYDFQVGDFLDTLFQMKDLQVSSVRAIFGLKNYYPAYPENLAEPTSTFEVVIRPYSPAASTGQPLALPELTTQFRSLDGGGTSGSGTGGGSSYDQSFPNPPGGPPSGM